MPEHIFGKTIRREFTALQDGEYVNLVSQAPSIFLFSELGNLADMIAGTGAFDHITYWQESNTPPYTRTYEVNPIADPDPSSSERVYGLWEIINYILEDGGSVVSQPRYFEVERALILDSTPGSTIQDAKDVFPAIEDYLTDVQLTAKLDEAEETTKLELEGLGYEWGKIKGLKKARLPLTYKVIQLACESQIIDEGDRFHIKASIYEKRYDSFMKSLKLGYDRDADGEQDSDVEAGTSSGYSIIVR